MQRFRSTIIAAAIVLALATGASAQRIRVNNFTPFNIRPDVSIRGGVPVSVNVNGFGVRHHNPNVFINSFGVPATVTTFSNHHGRFGNSTVFINGLGFAPPPTVFFQNSAPVLVTPSAVVPFGAPYGGYGYSGYGYSGFSGFSTGGCY